MNKLHGHGGLNKAPSVTQLVGQQPQQHTTAPTSIGHMGEFSHMNSRCLEYQVCTLYRITPSFKSFMCVIQVNSVVLLHLSYTKFRLMIRKYGGQESIYDIKMQLFVLLIILSLLSYRFKYAQQPPHAGQWWYERWPQQSDYSVCFPLQPAPSV